MATVDMYISVCDDCLVWIANADASGMDDSRYAEVLKGVEELNTYGHVVPACDSECPYGPSCDSFSSARCECCRTNLGGTRHRAAILTD